MKRRNVVAMGVLATVLAGLGGCMRYHAVPPSTLPRDQASGVSDVRVELVNDSTIYLHTAWADSTYVYGITRSTQDTLVTRLIPIEEIRSMTTRKLDVGKTVGLTFFHAMAVLLALAIVTLAQMSGW